MAVQLFKSIKFWGYTQRHTAYFYIQSIVCT